MIHFWTEKEVECWLCTRSYNGKEGTKFNDLLEILLAMATALLIQRELQQVFFLYKRTHLRACSFIQISGSDDRGKKFPRLSRIDERNSRAKFDFSLDPKFLNFPLNPSQKLLVDKLSSSNAREKKLWWHFFSHGSVTCTWIICNFTVCLQISLHSKLLLLLLLWVLITQLL